MAKQQNNPMHDSMEPTSALPFAARHCDGPYLDLIKNQRLDWVGELEINPQVSAPTVDLARAMATLVGRISQVEDLLASVEGHFDSAYRGSRPGGMTPFAQFQRGLRLLGLCRELVEAAVPDADEALERFCTVGDPQEGAGP